MKEERVYHREPPERVEPEKPPPRAASARPEGIFTLENRESFRSRWLEIQSSFIDEPRLAVDQAEGMVRELLNALSDRIEESRRTYPASREGGAEPSTESLRRALQSYRALFDRLASL
ncbi:MAG: hypothetical protein ACRD21_17780 [Vicinamibacteria bacterium]